MSGWKIIMTHAEAEIKFKKCHNKERGPKLADNTYLQKRGNAFAVRFYNTDVVMIRPDGTYRLNSGGHRTVSTKNRMNAITSCNISQTKGIWHIENTLYTDGMLIKPDNKVVEGEPVDNLLKIKAEVDRRVSKFIKLLIQGCFGCNIGEWDDYKGQGLPRHTSKIHLKRLWETIVVETNRQTENLSHYSWANAPIHLFKWIYLAILACGYDDPSFIWGLARNDLFNERNSIFVSSSLPRFMRLRKPLIAEMIANGELRRS